LGGVWLVVRGCDFILRVVNALAYFTVELLTVVESFVEKAIIVKAIIGNL
jgi:hypothetical protein